MAMLLLGSTAQLLSAQGRSAKIDKDLQRCLDAPDNTTVGMLECYWKAHDLMDKRLNVIYRRLLAKLAKPEQALLKDAQKKWLVYRDAELKFAAAADPSAGGSLGTVNRNAASYALLKARTAELEGYLSEIELSGE